MTGPMSLATFYVDGFYFCVPSRQVLELAPCPAITPVPLAPHAVHGLINRRGQIVTAIDLRTRLGLSARVGEEAPMVMYLTLRSTVFALVVDTICDILALDPVQFDTPPSHLSAPAFDLISGFHSLADKLLFVLDVDKLIYGCVDCTSPP